MTVALPHISPGSSLVPVIDWLNVHWHPLFAGISTSVDFILSVLVSALTYLPAYGLIAIIVVLALLLVGWRIALLCACLLSFCWSMGLWQESVVTIVQVFISVCITVAIAFPLGVVAARRRIIEKMLRPVLDVMQTVPPWVYLIPAVILFSLGSVPAIIATIIYSAPPMIRITTLAFRQIPKDLQELGVAIGARPLTILFKIEIPAAKPTLLVGLNQCIILSLAMVVLAGLVGASGLGGAVTQGLTRLDMGLGLRSGLGVVAIAILLDRVSRAALDRKPRRGV